MEVKNIGSVLRHAEKYGAEAARGVIEFAQERDGAKVARMIGDGTKEVLADRKRREEEQVRQNLITWGGRR